MGLQWVLASSFHIGSNGLLGYLTLVQSSSKESFVVLFGPCGMQETKNFMKTRNNKVKRLQNSSMHISEN